MRSRAALFFAAGTMVASSLGSAFALSRADAGTRAAAWLVANQQDDGSFFTPGSPADGVGDVVSALVASGSQRSSIDRALAYIGVHGPARASQRAAYAGRITMGLVAAGKNPRAFSGEDYVERIKSFYSRVTGTYDTGSSQFSNSLALLGLLAAGEKLSEEELRAVRLARCPDGGFSFDAGCSAAKGSDIDTTALVLCVLVGAGVPPSDGIRADARAFLIAAENQTGGHGFFSGEPTNANSEGLALAAIAALGEDPQQPPWRTPGGNPLSALLALQTADGGFRYNAARSRADNGSTVQAVVGVTGKPYPVAPSSHVLAERTQKGGRNRTAMPLPSGGTASLPAASLPPQTVMPEHRPPDQTLTVADAASSAPSPNRPIAPAALLLVLVVAAHVRRAARRHP